MSKTAKITAKSRYVDIETGEELTQQQVDTKYRKIRCEKTVKKLGWYTQIEYLWQCEANNQLTLKL